MLKEILTSPATLRVLFYALAPVLGMVPGVTLDNVAGTITIDVQTALIGIAAGLGIGGSVFAKFGKK
jgi:hypothetical protein